MEITLNDKTYTAPAPVTGLWFAIQKLKTEQEKRVAEITKTWEEIKPFEGREDLDDQAMSKLDNLMTELTKKTEENKRATLDCRIKTIVATFRDSKLDKELLLEHMPLQDVSVKYLEIESWLNDIVIGRTAQLPNV